MNLPEKIYFSGNKRIEWIYSVSGAKLRKTVYTNGAVTLTQDYVSGYVYKNNQLDFFFMEQGRVKKLVNGSLRYEYDIKDHLGNTRVCFADTNADGNAEILEESHYYAFGSRIEGLSTSSPNNKFTYNGKELEDDHGLNWYHYGARYFDPQLGRWHSIDPLDQFNSPFAYARNNPVGFTDKDGTLTPDNPESADVVTIEVRPLNRPGFEIGSVNNRIHHIQLFSHSDKYTFKYKENGVEKTADNVGFADKINLIPSSAVVFVETHKSQSYVVMSTVPAKVAISAWDIYINKTADAEGNLPVYTMTAVDFISLTVNCQAGMSNIIDNMNDIIGSKEIIYIKNEPIKGPPSFLDKFLESLNSALNMKDKDVIEFVK